MPPSTSSEQESEHTRKGVIGCCCWAFFLPSLGLLAGGFAGCINSRPVHGSGEWQGLGSLDKLFDTILGAFWGAVVGAILAVFIFAAFMIVSVARKTDDHAEKRKKEVRTRDY